MRGSSIIWMQAEHAAPCGGGAGFVGCRGRSGPGRDRRREPGVRRGSRPGVAGRRCGWSTGMSPYPVGCNRDGHGNAGGRPAPREATCCPLVLLQVGPMARRGRQSAISGDPPRRSYRRVPELHDGAGWHLDRARSGRSGSCILLRVSRAPRQSIRFRAIRRFCSGVTLSSRSR